MSDDAKAQERAERLAAALRANLRKRKAQARGGEPQAAGPGAGGGAEAPERDG